jgi:hypothetical protein
VGGASTRTLHVETSSNKHEQEPHNMNLKTPLIMTASLLAATLSLALPNLDLEITGAKEPVKGATMARRASLQEDAVASTQDASSPQETRP